MFVRVCVCAEGASCAVGPVARSILQQQPSATSFVGAMPGDEYVTAGGGLKIKGAKIGKK